MKVYIQKKDGEFINENAYAAYYGFNNLGYEIIPFEGCAPDFGRTPEDIVVGNIGIVVKALEDVGIAAPDQLATPPELYSYLGRGIGESTLKEIRNRIDKNENLPVFIKPKDHHKLFDGHVVRNFNNLIYTAVFADDIRVITSEVETFVSEYRGFVLKGELIGCKHYKGDFTIHPDYDIIQKAIKDIKKPLVAYSIDFGVTSEDNTKLLELNDSYALGAYGIKPNLYVQMILWRWKEMIETPPRIKH